MGGCSKVLYCEASQQLLAQTQANAACIGARLSDGEQLVVGLPHLVEAVTAVFVNSTPHRLETLLGRRGEGACRRNGVGALLQ
jgi:hypothetical protein